MIPSASELTRLFGELASPVRMGLLHGLAREPGTVTSLSVAIGLSPQEVSRHLARLGNHYLVARDASRTYHLTPFARVLLEELPSFAALQRQRAFFEGHDLSGLPRGLPVRPLASAQHVAASESDNMQRVFEGLQRGPGRATYAGNQVGWAAGALRARARDGGEVELVLPWTLAGSEALLAFDQALGPEGARRTTVRLVEAAPLLLAITPDEAFAFFPAPRGAIDFTLLVRDAAPAFRSWAEGVAAGLRAASVLAFDPARHAPGEWRRAITVAAGGFVGRRRSTPAPTATQA